MKLAYVVKRYPRFSETFIVNEILAHEAAGTELEICSLLPPVDTHFQAALARVRGPVTYLSDGDAAKSSVFWSELTSLGAAHPGLWPALARAGEASAREVSQALHLARHVQRRRITHLHAHFASSATAVARLASLITGVPYSFTAHAKDIFHESVSADDLRLKAADAAAVITVSQFNVDYLRPILGVHADRIHHLNNGIELDQFPFAEPKQRPRKIIAIGRLVEKKGFHVLIEACRILRASQVSFECLIVGGGEEESRLQRLVSQHQLQAFVQLTGPRPQPEIARLVQSAAVLAAPCVVGADGNRDGLPTVLLEAMALGTPCVATPVTGIPEVIRHGETGLLVDPNEASQLADALQVLLDDGGQRVKLARAARARIERDFDIHQNASRQRALLLAAGARREEALCA